MHYIHRYGKWAWEFDLHCWMFGLHIENATCVFAIGPFLFGYGDGLKEGDAHD